MSNPILVLPSDILFTTVAVLIRRGVDKNVIKKIVSYIHDTATIYDITTTTIHQTINNINHGSMRIFGNDGILIAKKYYKDGDMHGKSWRLYPNGRLAYENNYLDGKMHGVCRTWHVNGNISSKTIYNNGKKCGFQYWWNTKGKMTHKVNHDEELRYVKSKSCMICNITI